MLKTIVISGPISGIGQLSVKLKRNLAQKILLSFFWVVFQAKLPFIVELEGNIHVNVCVKHHLLFGFFISFSPCNIMEIYKIECPVEPNVRNMSFSPFFSWVVFLPFILQARSVWFCVRDAQTWRLLLLRTNTISWWKERRTDARPISFGSEKSQESPFHSSCSAQLLTQVGENGTRLPLSPKIPHGSLALGCALLRLCISKKTGRISPFSR